MSLTDSRGLIGGFRSEELAAWADARLTRDCKNDQGRVDPDQCSRENCRGPSCLKAEAVADYFTARKS